LKKASRAKGASRIFIHGEKEFEEAEKRTRQGIPLNSKVVEDLRVIARELSISEPF
jgi:LDH2 family malate/lactate/ureidoglycolate dehydrogenase